MKNNEKYTREVLEEAVRDSLSVQGVLRRLGLKMAGGTHAHVSRRIKTFGIDTSHFLGQAANQGQWHKGSGKTPWQDVLVLRQFGHRQKAHVLRRALIESGRAYHCERHNCPVGAEWLGKRMILHVNHKNGNWLDDRAQNVQFLCPNCHSQTPNYCGGKGLSDVTRVFGAGRERQRRLQGPVAE